MTEDLYFEIDLSKNAHWAPCCLNSAPDWRLYFFSYISKKIKLSVFFQQNKKIIAQSNHRNRASSYYQIGVLT